MNFIDVKAISFQRKRRRRVGRGRGSGMGKTSGRGGKGATARSGNETRIQFEGGQTPLFRRLPKRGFNNPFKKKYAIVNIKDIARFDSGTTVTMDKLLESGIIKKVLDGIKILGEGEIKNVLTVVAHKFSRVAMEKIEAAGGKAKVLS
ncbi:MAG: 50S ribosomal protein L15 [Candidatus Brocadia sp. AMX2]|uniref:Large ribosomal subunit protein uL15 n=1 Tax=Candidatus Brocadia sinica JPN1 TaxID=1197129 RepID=A0ABQ0JY67_9BACT|nr:MULTISPECIES: 50S ribosomal protein L15 [Brocadia]KXK26346.1 MAG: 50S ribosomal protein L15 [Candidatus Brocadia sinica]MBC6932918.1 50S ribosomal protein L15 [Candidatus Brocadia sp.]MBL1167596.1 50S ribosomal protein L15 [Candidatus Brocadia sp. AMX1]NOG40515.1 50S ribosomal protein L15 [Planctomycetota bacterium]KAA0242057.1 MAG: 50S ribosomal protein L15 [Candidatus Brocadia sp. AMX2]